MNLLINPDELAASLARQILRRRFLHTPFQWSSVAQYVRECQVERQRSGHIVIDFNEVNRLINKEINGYKQQVSADFKNQLKPLIKFLIEHKGLDNLPCDFLIDCYLSDPRKAFVKGIGPQLTDNPHYITRLADACTDQPFLIRNVLGNEDLLKLCMKDRHPFWFVDSGYTNFLHNKHKIWHRLVRNHIHHGRANIDYPDDRLCLLTSQPRTWRKKGRTILVVESSHAHYAMHGTTLNKWKDQIVNEITKYTDRPIEFRSKEFSRKNRSTVYDLLCNSKEYHCVVSDSSSATIEAIWAGVPAVTLRRHISNGVTRSKLSDIENLYKDDIEPWVRAVSYNQFTFDELCNGTALSIIRTYGYV